MDTTPKKRGRGRPRTVNLDNISDSISDSVSETASDSMIISPTSEERINLIVDMQKNNNIQEQLSKDQEQLSKDQEQLSKDQEQLSKDALEIKRDYEILLMAQVNVQNDKEKYEILKSEIMEERDNFINKFEEDSLKIRDEFDSKKNDIQRLKDEVLKDRNLLNLDIENFNKDKENILKKVELLELEFAEQNNLIDETKKVTNYYKQQLNYMYSAGVGLFVSVCILLTNKY